MDLREIAQHCWDKRLRLPFHLPEGWAPDTFTEGWFCRQQPNLWVKGKECAGWYWFELEMPLDDLQALECPVDLTNGGCDFGATAKANVTLLGDDLCQRKAQLSVVYNGHEKNVFSRVRAHFAVDNPRTGALGINRYPLHSNRWHVSAYVMKHLEYDEGLTASDKVKIHRLCSSKTGRVAVEQMWRTIYGWPVLCKA